ncbi:metalloprotease [Brevundimonas sp.]|uniref:metalloprotease n=1 Tax=Brevundimonas sp. TaxID=1871086 RepID=UPI002FC9F235
MSQETRDRSKDIGPWGRRPGTEILPPAVSIHELRAREGRAKRGWIGLVLSTLLMVGFLWFLTQSWVIAVSLMFALLVHEYGHVLAMNRLGMGPARIYVIPFLGGLAKATHEPKNEWIGVLVSLAGPAFGLLAMVPLVAIGLATGDGQWMAAAFFVAMLNLINLVPAPPLDGSKALGPVLARVHPQLEKLVLLVIGVAVVVWGITTGRYILAVFLGLAIWGHLSKGGLRSVTGPLSWKQAGLSLGLFVLTAVACGGAAVASLLALNGGSGQASVDMIARYLGIAL